jgi:hypothetical protein
MHAPIKVKSPNNTNKWQMGFDSAFKGLRRWTFASTLSSLLQFSDPLPSGHAALAAMDV